MMEDKNWQVTKDSTLLDRINALKQEDETLYKMLAVDVWALAQTMDEFHPGFWTTFMANREKALKRFVQDAVKDESPTESKRPPYLR